MPKGTIVTDTFTRTVTGGVGPTDTGQTYTLFGTTGDFGVGGGGATISQSETNTWRAAILESFSEADVDVAITGVVGGPATGAPLEFLNLMTRGQDDTSYLGRVQLGTDGILTAFLFAPDGTTLDSVDVPVPAPASTDRFRLRVQSIGQYHRLKVWDVSGAEPPHWLLTVKDDSHTGAGWIGWRVGIPFGNTNPKPYAFSLDDFASVQVPDYATDPVPVQVLWAPGANLADDYRTWPWEDITADVRQDSPVSITVGRGDEASVTQPAEAQLQLNNPNKAYSAYDPASTNYPNVRRNTPFWVLAGPATRAFVYADGFNQSTLDVSGKVPVVSVSAHGVLRRLTQGKTPLNSPAFRGILATKPLTYYPLEDAKGASQFASGLPGGDPATLGGVWNLAADSDLIGSKPLPTMTASSTLGVHVTGIFAARWQVDWHMRLSKDPGDPLPNPTPEFPLMVVTSTDAVVRWEFVVGNNGFQYYALHGYNGSGTLVVDSGHFSWDGNMTSGKWCHFYLTTRQNGANIDWRLLVYPSLGGPGTVLTHGSVAGAWGGPRFVAVPASASLDGVGLGHVAVYDAYDYTQPGLPLFGYPGDTATDRLSRLCAEEGVPLTVIGESGTLMGPQGVDTFVNLLRECEAADGGLLYDGLGPGLTYLARTSRYNIPASLTLDASLGELAPPFAPTDDDQRTRNKWEISRKGGSSATVEDTDGPLGTDAVGVYDDSATLNLLDDSRLRDNAGWRVHQGTTEGFRYPKLSLNLRGTPGLSDDWLSVELSGRIDVANVSSATAQHADADLGLLLEGYNETIADYVWDVESNTSPYRPWEVWKIGDTRLGRLGTGNRTTLNQAYAAGATSIKVATTGPLWVTTANRPTRFPMDLDINGWRVHVTAISGTSSPQTFTVDPLPAALTSGAPVRMWKPGVLAL